MTEFAIVIPVLLILIGGLIEFSHILFARSILNMSAESALELATVVNDLEIPGVDGRENDEAVTRVLTRAMQSANIHFKNGTNIAELSSQFPPQNSGRRLTNIDLEIGEVNEDGDIRPDLSTFLSLNPIIVTVTAEVPTFFSFIGQNWNLSARVAGFREPKFISTIPSILDCNGNPISAANMQQPNVCPCLGNPNDPNLFQTGSTCFCLPPYQPVPPGNPRSCVCPSDTRNGDLANCRCKPCLGDPPNGQGWSGVHPNSVQQNQTNCACSCKAPFVQNPAGSRFCNCPANAPWDATFNNCWCNLEEFTQGTPENPAQCPPPNIAYRDGLGRCICSLGCVACRYPDGTPCYDPNDPTCTRDGQPCGSNTFVCRNEVNGACSCSNTEECRNRCQDQNPNWSAPPNNIACQCYCKHPTTPNAIVTTGNRPAGHPQNPCPMRAYQEWRQFPVCECRCSDVTVATTCRNCVNPTDPLTCNNGRCLFPNDPASCRSFSCCRPIECDETAGCYWDSTSQEWKFPEG